MGSPPTAATTTNCTECLTSTDCLFIIFEETSQKCETIDYKPPSDPIEPTIITDLSKCNSGGDDPSTTLSPAPDRTSSSTTKITTTTTAATTTTSTRTTTTSTTTISESTTSNAIPVPEPDR